MITVNEVSFLQTDFDQLWFYCHKELQAPIMPMSY